MTIKLSSFLPLLCTLFFFSSCQKEFLPEDGIIPGTTTGTATFTFTGAPGNCASPIITGIFQAGSPTDPSNNISVQVNVSDTGSYSISSSSVNGIIFSGNGTFSLNGLQTITLKASGTPTVSGPFIFSLGISACTFTINCNADPVITGDCKECIYLPFCVGSQFEYYDSVFNPLSGDTAFSIRHSNYLSAADTTIGGSLYKKIEFSDGTNSNYGYVNCFNGVTTTISYNVQSSTSGNILLAIKSVDLKANAAVGSNWSDTSVFANGNIFYRKHTITEKGISRVILGVTYNDIIKVSVDQHVLYTDPPLGLVAQGVTEYYIAKGIGLVETITYGENPFTNENYVAYHAVLKSYLIP